MNGQQPMTALRDPATLRHEIRSVGRHSLVYLLGPAFSNLVGFVLIPIYTRYIDRSQYGVMSLIDVVMTIVMMAIGLGLAEGLTRFYYEQPDTQTRQLLVSTTVLGSALLSLPMIVLAISFAAGLQRMLGLTDMYVGYLRLALLTSWFSMLAEIGFSYLRLGYYAKTFVMVTALQIVAAVSLNILFVVGLDWGIWGILYSTAIVQALLGGGLTVVLLSRCGLGICRRQLAELLRLGTHLVPATVALQLTNYLSPLLLRWLLSGDPLTVLAQIGLFSAGQKIGVVVNRFVTVPFNAFWKPRRMELAVQNTADVRHVLARMCSYATLVTCQIALLVSVGAEDLLRMALHPDYWEAHRVVPLVCAGYVILGLEHHFGTGMLYAKRTWCAPWIGVVALLVLVVADLFMIPRFGIVAAAGATVMSVTVRSGLFYAVSQRYYRIPYELSRLGSMAILAGMLYWIAMQIHLPSVPAQFAARLAVGFCFAPCSLMLGVIHTAELRGVLART